MSLRSFHIFFIATALAFLAFLLYWSGRGYVQDGRLEDLPLAVCALAGLVVGVPYLVWFTTQKTALAR
jgi:hypothetical protein